MEYRRLCRPFCHPLALNLRWLERVHVLMRRSEQKGRLDTHLTPLEPQSRFGDKLLEF